MSKKELDIFKNCLIEDLTHKYNMNIKTAKEAVCNSAINNLLKENEQFVMHYPMDAWVDNIYNEYNNLPVEI